MLHDYSCNQQQGGKTDLPQLAVGVAFVMVLVMVSMMVSMMMLMMVLVMMLMVLFGVVVAVCATMRAMFVVMVCHILSFLFSHAKVRRKFCNLVAK